MAPLDENKKKQLAPLDENKKKQLVNYLVRGDLVKVVDAYEKCPESQKCKIPRTGDTALHVAVSDDWEEFVERMVKVAESDVLKMRNGQGETALHLAAKFGSTYLCKLIAQKDPSLVGERNDYGETPLFSAVSRGKTKAFLYLHNFCKDKACLDYGSYTRNDGDTILHSAISGQHFSMAYIIIREYPELMHKVNEDRVSPLCLLATIPSVFPSGVRLSGIRKLVYHCIRVPKLEKLWDVYEVPDPHPQPSWKTHLKRRHLNRILENREDDAQVCYEENDHQDEEAPTDKKKDEEAPKTQVDHKENLQRDETATHDDFDDLGCMWLILLYLLFFLYWTVYRPFRLLRYPLKLAKYILGYEEYVRVKHRKEKCIWSVEVMNKLINPPNSKHKHAFEQGENLAEPSNEEDKHIKERCICSAEGTNKVIPYNSKYAKEQRPPKQVTFTLHLKYDFEEGEILAEPSNEEDKHIKERCICSTEGTNKDIPYNSTYAKEQRRKQTVESPLLVAAKHGVSEMVSGILDADPGAIHVVNSENKNVVMLAVEHRHPRLYQKLVDNWEFKKSIFEKVDIAGNSLLHLAAKLEDGKQFWRIQGAALHMQMEIKWYKFIKKSMPPRFFARYNNARQTSKEIFKESHRHLIEEGRQWLTSTSQSCSVVAALIATVAFATSATVPGGLKQDNGVPSLEHKPFFIVSAASSLIALSFSMLSVVMFLGILTSNFKLKDFRKILPYKLLLGLISLLISIVSMFISFYAGHFFVLKQELNHYATQAYMLLCIPLVVFIISKFPLDFEVVWTTLRKKPHN